MEFLRLYRGAVQLVVNELWNLNTKLSRKKLHELFYDKLRGCFVVDVQELGL